MFGYLSWRPSRADCENKRVSGSWSLFTVRLRFVTSFTNCSIRDCLFHGILVDFMALFQEERARWNPRAYSFVRFLVRANGSCTVHAKLSGGHSQRAKTPGSYFPVVAAAQNYAATLSSAAHLMV